MKRKLLQRLVGPSTVLCIRFEEADRYAMRLFVLGYDRSDFRILRECADPDADALKKECSGRPVLISVSGYGIVTKPTEDTAIVEKVTSDPETFAWSFSDEKEDSGSISFVRREQVEPLGQRLAENGIPFMDIRYGRTAADPEQEALRQAERFYRDTLKWRTLLRPTPEGRMSLKRAERRLRLPRAGPNVASARSQYVCFRFASRASRTAAERAFRPGKEAGRIAGPLRAAAGGRSGVFAQAAVPPCPVAGPGSFSRTAHRNVERFGRAAYEQSIGGGP